MQSDRRSPPKTDPDSDPWQVLLETYGVNERMHQVVLEHLDPAAWRAQMPGVKGRTLAAIFAHVHNVRRKWLRLSAPHLALPAPLHRVTCTQEQVRAALAESATLCGEMLGEALGGSDHRVKLFRRDALAKSWPTGPAMVTYMITHEAHHRGQACMLAHQLGYQLPSKATAEMWAWERLWKRCGFEGPE